MTGAHAAAAAETVAFVQARNYTPGRRKPIRLVVMHDMESPEKPNTAEACADYFAHTTREASAHDCVDNDSAVQCVHDGDTAWAAPGANSDGIQIELAGYAKQALDDWLDPYGKQLLEMAAQRVALRCKKYGIPVRWLSVAQVADGVTKGICGHADVTKAFPALHGTHTDPGSGFPKSYFLGRVRVALGDPPVDPPHPPGPTPLRVDGVLGTLTVRRFQSYLNAHGARPRLVVDGDVGPSTWKAVDLWLDVSPANGTPGHDTVRALQRKVGSSADGILGSNTIRALQRFLNAAL